MASIFISSTGKDLTEYRQGAIEVCNRLRLVPIAMEFFEAMGIGATDGSKKRLDQSTAYVGIFAHRYGYIEVGHDRSVTEVEFDYAGELGLDRLCFLVRADYPWPPDLIDYEHHAKLRAFKTKVNQLIRAEFTKLTRSIIQITRPLGCHVAVVDAKRLNDAAVVENRLPTRGIPVLKLCQILPKRLFIVSP